MRKIQYCLLFICFVSTPLLAESTSVSAPRSETVEDWKKEEVREKVEESAFTKIFARMIGLLLVTVLLLVAFAWIAKRFLSSRQLTANRQSRIQIIERRAINPKAAIVLIKIDNEEFLIAESSTGVTILKEIKGAP